LVLYIVKLLSRKGLCAALLSRGYGRSDPVLTRVISPRTAALAAEVGDEPALLRLHAPELWLGISSSRFRAGRRILQQLDNPIFVLDDGFQHRALHRDLDIVIMDPSDFGESGHLLPRGTLREPASALQRAHALVFSGTEDSLAQTDYRRYSGWGVGEERVFRCRQKIVRFVPYLRWPMAGPEIGDSILPQAVFLVAAIARPERFLREIQEQAIDVRGFRFYRDHSCLQESHWAFCAAEARRAGAECLVITEKDAVKISIPPPFPTWVAMQETRFRDPERFEKLVLRACGIDSERDPA